MNPFPAHKRYREQEFEECPTAKRFLSENLASQIYNLDISSDNSVSNSYESENFASSTDADMENPIITEVDPNICNPLVTHRPKQDIQKKSPIVPPSLLPAEYTQRAIVLYKPLPTILSNAVNTKAKNEDLPKNQEAEKEDIDMMDI
mmetsp:Transcript_129168/g.192435  ORF Transcript_129168/g.192435 Transcript_129168/m.192435 type:complete len:147 (+) Transcript_129168:3-443(+)